MSTTTIRDNRCSECGEWFKLGHAIGCSRHPAATRSQQDGYRSSQGLIKMADAPGFKDGPLRALRLWHWVRYLRYTEYEKNYRDLKSSYHADKNRRYATEHLKFVQALNDCFEIGDTAEKDAVK